MSNTAPTLLLIDDDPDLLLGLAALLQRRGYRTVSANNGTEGLRLAQTFTPDLIICDVMMPHPNGWALRGMLAERVDTAKIPFIFLTARAEQKDKNAGLSIGADDYITKPFDLQEFYLRVEAVLRRQELGRAAGRAEAEREIEKFKQMLALMYRQEFGTPLPAVMDTLDAVLPRSFEIAPEQSRALLQEAMQSPEKIQTLIQDVAVLSSAESFAAPGARDPIDIQVDFMWPVQNLFAKYSHKDLGLKLILEPDSTNWASVFRFALADRMPLPATRIVVHAPRAAFTSSVLSLVSFAAQSAPMHGQVGVNLAYNGVGGCVLTLTAQGPTRSPEMAEAVFAEYPPMAEARAFAQSMRGDVVFLDAVSGCRVRMTLPPG